MLCVSPFGFWIETATTQLSYGTSYNARALCPNILIKNGFCNVLTHQKDYIIPKQPLSEMNKAQDCFETQAIAINQNYHHISI
jgi:hypothetical protein